MTAPLVLLLPVVPLLTANGRYQRQQKARMVKAIRQAAAEQAREELLPRLDRHVRIIGEYLPSTRSGRRDPANWAPSAKAAVDGLVDAGVLIDDSHKYVTGPDMRLGELAYVITGQTTPRLRLLITEIQGETP